ncbi:Lipocalin-like domain-containing protein [Chaetomidium leptoderma]|uniref:Lipocalin-like domain-containing protein n=1 Tax=Chaetomidium leptoderma TaxID=669021 RepID=A0AAN6VGK0_9PEZI|nr:Lipocalin-like domain-containing protein [Chaetomidium leptoderma]
MKTDHIIAALAGTYSLINSTPWRNGTESPSPWGRNPVGLLTYTRYGYMSANMAATEENVRPLNIRWPPKDTDADEDWVLVGRHAMSYAGVFSINQSVPATKFGGQLVHGPMIAASVPAMVGSTSGRNYAVHEREDATYLLVSIPSDDPNFRSEIWWKRVVKG